MAESEAPSLLVLSEQLRGVKFSLTKKSHSCGRVDDRDICIKDPTISTHHCDFVQDGDGYRLVDNKSTNGTRVNNVPIAEQKLKKGDIVQLGGVELLFDCPGGSVMSTRTMTDIDVDVDLGETTTNLPNRRKGGAKKTKGQMVMIAVVIVLVLVIIGLVIAILA